MRRMEGEELWRQMGGMFLLRSMGGKSGKDKKEGMGRCPSFLRRVGRFTDFLKSGEHHSKT
jgi:hypothetical protein